MRSNRLCPNIFISKRILSLVHKFIVYFLSSRTSGQTWLQLQQQKLRAKKEQQNNGAEYFARKIHTENRNRPLRYVLRVVQSTWCTATD